MEFVNIYPDSHKTKQTTEVAKPIKEFIKDDIQKSLELSLKNNTTYDIIAPTQEEIQHVSVLFKSRQLDNINVINYKVVSDIGQTEFNNLNNKLKEFTSKIAVIKAPGFFNLIDELTQNVNNAELDLIWEKTVNAKPTISARFLSIFNSKAIGNNLQKQYQSVYKLLTERSKGLEVKLGSIEQKLVQQKHEQENNIAMLTTSFEMYYHAFQEVRKQFIFTLYLEEFYKQEVEKYKQENTNHNSLEVAKQLSEYEGILSDIENKRLVLHGTLIKFPITVQQNNQLIKVSKNILKEIDTTLTSDFTSIRSNLLGLGVCLNNQQAMLGTNAAKTLNEQSAKLSSKIIGELAVKSELFAGDSRLREAESIRDLVANIRTINEQVDRAKIENQQKINRAQELLNESTNELKQIIGQA